MKLSVVNTSGKEVKTLDASDVIFAADIKQDVIHSVVRWQRAKKRSGTHATLNLGRMEGGGRKPFKQKGLGRARAGSRNSPLWVGGAVIFGPQPRDYSYRMPRKVKRQALLGTLSAKAQEGALVVVDGFGITKPKTKEFVKILNSLKITEGEKRQKIAFVFSDGEEPAAVSARNIASVSCLPVKAVNVYDVMNATRLLMSADTFQELEQQLLSQGRDKSESKVEDAGAA